MKEIRLSNSAAVVLVDDEDYDWLNQWTWRDNGRRRATRSYRIKGKHYHAFIHRMIMNAPTGVEVDHIDRNPLNNQKSNLRFATRQQNQSNAPKQNRPSTSKYKGVFFYKRYNAWRAAIKSNGKSIYLGTFPIDQEIEAAKAYDKAAKQHFKEFAYVNFPDE